MRTLLDGEVDVHYWQLYVESGDVGTPDLEGAFAAQANGICGAAVPYGLFLITGLHTGTVGFRVELHEAPPRLDDEWEDIVEVSFRPATAEVALLDWDGQGYPLDLEPTDYRVRYCASGMDEARAQDTRLEDELLLDRYLLQFWPAPPAPDRVLKQTSEVARSEHRHVRGLPPGSEDAAPQPEDAPPGPEDTAPEPEDAAQAELGVRLQANVPGCKPNVPGRSGSPASKSGTGADASRPNGSGTSAATCAAWPGSTGTSSTRSPTPIQPCSGR